MLGKLCLNVTVVPSLLYCREHVCIWFSFHSLSASVCYSAPCRPAVVLQRFWVLHYCPFGGLLLLLSWSLKAPLGTPCWQDECLLRFFCKLKIQFISMHVTFCCQSTKKVFFLLSLFRSSSGTFHQYFLLLRMFPISEHADFCSISYEASRWNQWSLVELPHWETDQENTASLSDYLGITY